MVHKLYHNKVIFFKQMNDLVEATTNLILFKILKKVDLKKIKIYDCPLKLP